MKKILVAYATNAGSTVQVAQTVAEEIAKGNVQVDVLPIDQIHSIEMYDAVVLGAPMIMGWHRGALGFLKKHRNAFRKIPLAVFVTAMSLTKTGETIVSGVPIIVDEKLPKPPIIDGKLNWRERYARIPNYAKPIVSAIAPAKPVNIAFFGGCLQYGRLQWWAVLFALVIVQAQAGDKRNWAAIRAWAADLPLAFDRARPSE